MPATATTNVISLLLEDTATGFGQTVSLGDVSPAASGNTLFFGVVNNADAFNRIIVRSPNRGDGLVLDDITVATSVIPEPSTCALLAVGLVALLGTAQRRRHLA